MIRINKFLSQCGVASRRNADVLVTEGRVTVNGEMVTTPGRMIDETSDQVIVDGRPVAPAERHLYLVLNKPAGYVTSLSDPHHTKTVMLLVADVPIRVYPVGRLDLDTEGTLLFTNDGELAHRLTHPRYAVPRIYRARVTGNVSDETTRLFPKGITLPDGAIGHAQAAIEENGADFTLLRLELTEGRKREVKHLCKAVGHPVLTLTRVSFAGITASGLAPGTWRYLSDREVAELRRVTRLAADQTEEKA